MIYPNLPQRALSIMQPWAWLIVNGHKDIENRDWPTRFRGEVAIHAGKKADVDCLYALTCADGPRHPVTGAQIPASSKLASFPYPAADYRGGIVGVAEIIGCVEGSANEWFVGRYGFVIRNARPVPFIPVRGALGFFDWRKNLA